MSNDYLYDLFINDLKKLSQNGGSMSGGGSGGTSRVVDTKILDALDTTALNSTFGIYVANVEFNELKSIPEKVSVNFDYVLYDDLQIVEMPGYGFMFGNLGMANTLLGTSFEVTDEPFLAVMDTNSATFFTLDAEETRHFISMSVPEECIKEEYKKYLPDIPVIDLLEAGLTMFEAFDSSCHSVPISDDFFNRLIGAVERGPVSVRFAANVNTRVPDAGSGSESIVVSTCCSSINRDIYTGEVNSITLVVDFAEETYRFIVYAYNKTLYAYRVEGETLQ